MIKRIKCLIKGHKFLMNYNEQKKYYHPSRHDKCSNCNKKRNNV